MDTTNKYLQTEWFEATNIPGVNYAIKIYPNADRGGEAWITLSLSTGGAAKVRANVRLSIESARWSYEYVHVFEKDINNIGNTYCKTCDLLCPPYIVDGKMTVKCEGILSIERQSDDVASNNKLKKNEFWGKTWNGIDTDFTIVVGEETFPVSFYIFPDFLFFMDNYFQIHKLVLAAHSSIFEAMFNSDSNETTIESQMEIVDFDLDIVKLVLEIIYDRNVPTTLTMEQKMNILQFSHKYDIQKIKVGIQGRDSVILQFKFQDSIEASLAENISFKTVCQITKFAFSINSVNLQKRCEAFLVASYRMGLDVSDLHFLEKDFALKVLKTSLYWYISQVFEK